ncbi:hypothetical protein [Staphylococcus warneri]|uniref:hypothetical protein n=1 Tax=Staphylococcus warneri TaxID=1292 RepID=UPI001A8DBA5A|nr:hypothetical protein [Staphylococcus warneri]MBO0377090.1 hypothetical protein [Staphylococcus warneri]MCR1798128.1 hypothetical protein [Staphylococcus warneri]HCU8763852.1 hypothetical protein [Staphylococcus aureus]
MADEKLTTDRAILIAHTKTILNSNVKVPYIAQQIDMNVKQIYSYRNGHKDIEKAQIGTLLKFERFYQKIKDQL